MKKGVIFLFWLISQFGWAQSDLSLRLNVSPWQFVHKFDQLSHPPSISYSSGINFEKLIDQSNFAVLSGIDYTYAPKGNAYIDLSDGQNLVAVIYEQEFNKRYIALPHHEFAVPILLIYYYNNLRIGLGASYSQIVFGKLRNNEFKNRYSDYGLRVQFGARLSKLINFSIAYYYGLNKFATITAFPSSGVVSPSISGNMQQLSVGINYSIFNRIGNQKYYLSSLQP